jgi:heme exporter protein D
MGNYKFYIWIGMGLGFLLGMCAGLALAAHWVTM